MIYPLAVGPMQVFLKSDWNFMTERIKSFGHVPADFDRIEGGSMPGGGTITHRTSGMSFSFRRDESRSAGYVLYVGTKTIRSSTVVITEMFVGSNDRFWGQLDRWLGILTRYVYEFDRQEQIADLWEKLLKEPTPNAAQTWQPADVFTAETVADVRARVDAAFREIEERVLVQRECDRWGGCSMHNGERGGPFG